MRAFFKIYATAMLVALTFVPADAQSTNNNTDTSKQITAKPIGPVVITDGTLKGTGTQASPLGVGVPLELSGSDAAQIVKITNFANGGGGLKVQGGSALNIDATPAIIGMGGGGSNGFHGGAGVRGFGGFGENAGGGNGIVGNGGNTSGNFVGGGSGVVGTGGNGINSGAGGAGVVATGGIGRGANHKGGYGLVAAGGSGEDGAADGAAAIFAGDVLVIGNFSVGAGGTKNFKIDHPLDPENKYLYHAAVESSEVLNIYSGNVKTDSNGDATVTLPAWFEAVNSDFRYQLTVVGAFAQAIVSRKVRSNQFAIKTNSPNVEVSWQVTGVRSDPGMLKRPFTVEEDKPQEERGRYLDPAAYGQAEERSIKRLYNP